MKAPCPSCGWSIGHVIGCPGSRNERVARVWVQCGNAGVSVPPDQGYETALELLARGSRRIASIHVRWCALSHGGRCTCEPTWVSAEVLP